MAFVQGNNLRRRLSRHGGNGNHRIRRSEIRMKRIGVEYVEAVVGPEIYSPVGRPDT